MTKATLTFIGGKGAEDAKGTMWGGISFPKDEPVAVTDENLIRKAKGHDHFRIDEPAEDAPAKKGKKAAAEDAPAADGA